MKFVDDYVDAHEDGVLAGIREQNNPQSGKGYRQQREGFEEKIDVDVVGKPDYNSDGLHSVHEDEDGDGNNNECYPELNEKIDMKNPYLSLGLIFRDDAQFRKALVMHSMINGFCVRHLYTNYREQFKGKALKDALWAVAKTTTIPHFRRAMEELKLLNEDAYDWLMKRPANHWSRSHFQTQTKCEMLLNNLCESFNAVIVKAKSKPIVTMLQIIYTMLMRKIQMRKDIMVRQPGDLCPKIKKKLEDAKMESGRCITQWSVGTKFQVDAKGGDQYVVDLTKLTCSCRRYDLTGIPCNHTIATINYKREKLEDYVDICYSKVMYLEIYGHLIQHMNGMSMWEVTENPPIQPSLYTRQPGRPKKKINKEAAEMEK
ncbi:uncharacterized protein [Pyrus communis]|uniref:uncharacterized protein n=1 Tax=Pyrus communis TaxID=23211 RepID=UPI0035C009BF